MKVIITGKDLTIEKVVNVARQFEEVELSQEVIKHIEDSASLVDQFIKNKKKLYGVTTGFGALANSIIPQDKIHELQYNIIISHATAVGDPFPTEIVRAAMLLKLNTLASGCCGVRLKTVKMLIDMLNKRIHPIIPSKGSLGASGDLAPLAHMALVMIGKGTAEYNGNIILGSEALRLAGLTPLELEAKEGLSLVNGTQIMAAIGALAIYDTETLLKNADIAATMTAEALKSNEAPFDEEVHKLRPHPGQIKCARNIRKLIKESKLIGSNGITQDPYSIRCIPQVNGAVKDTIEFCRKIMETEINAVTDNPVILLESKRILSCGHFHGEYLAFALDFLAIAIAELADIAERRIARLVDPKLSGLAAFLINEAGVNSGFMIPHYTAAALVSENKILCHPASVDSIPTSANQEDHVSMGATAANKLLQVIFNVQNVICIEYICAAQALDLINGKQGIGTNAAYKTIRKKIKFLEKDEELHGYIMKSFELVKNGEIVRDVETAIGGLE